ncbi:11324_t:CDS:2, partial [Gigaspora margarita]
MTVEVRTEYSADEVSEILARSVPEDLKKDTKKKADKKDNTTTDIESTFEDETSTFFMTSTTNSPLTK